MAPKRHQSHQDKRSDDMATQAASNMEVAIQADEFALPSELPEAILSLNVGHPKKPQTAKLSPRKRKEFLYWFGKTHNQSYSAARVGVTSPAIDALKANDEHFAKAFKLMSDAHLDTIEQVSFKVALSPSREGFQDRKLLLQAHRREIYGDKVQVDSQVKVNVEHSIPQLSAILAGNGLRELSGPQEIPFQEVREENQIPVKSKVTKKD